MIVAKKFKWEAAHRLPWHTGKCKQLHGHSYKMIVEFFGDPNTNGMIIDFNDIKTMIEPLIQKIDHSTIISKTDLELKEIFDNKGWKYFLLPFDSTAENLCKFFLTTIISENQPILIDNKISKVSIKIFETETAYAYDCAVVL